jgi:hypothetical protein
VEGQPRPRARDGPPTRRGIGARRKGPTSIEVCRLDVESARRAVGAARAGQKFAPSCALAAARFGALGGLDEANRRPRRPCAPARRTSALPKRVAGSLASALREPAWNPIPQPIGSLFAAKEAKGPSQSSKPECQARVPSQSAKPECQARVLARLIVALRLARLCLASAQAHGLGRGAPVPTARRARKAALNGLASDPQWPAGGGELSQVVLSSCFARNGLSLIPLAATVRASFACCTRAAPGGISQVPQIGAPSMDLIEPRNRTDGRA